jgi:hypothetical protein
MKLLTKEILAKLPPLGSQCDDEDPVIQIKFFTADAGWTWYVVDGSLERETGDFIFFGYVVGPCPEWGNFSLKELQGIRGALGLSVERDLHFRRQRFSELHLPFQF